MKKLVLAAAFSAALLTPLATAADYMIDVKGAHASINFKISHLGYSWLLGRFDKFDGEFSYDQSDVAASKIKVSVDVTSLNSNHAERDKHLKSDDFLNADKFSTATFTSTSVKDLGDGKLEVVGDLELHGVKKSITIDADKIGEGKDPWGGYRAGFAGTTKLSLKDFGIKVLGPSTHAIMDLHIEGIRK